MTQIDPTFFFLPMNHCCQGVCRSQNRDPVNGNTNLCWNFYTVGFTSKRKSSLFTFTTLAYIPKITMKVLQVARSCNKISNSKILGEPLNSLFSKCNKYYTYPLSQPCDFSPLGIPCCHAPLPHTFWKRWGASSLFSDISQPVLGQSLSVLPSELF